MTDRLIGSPPRSPVATGGGGHQLQARPRVGEHAREESGLAVRLRSSLPSGRWHKRALSRACSMISHADRFLPRQLRQVSFDRLWRWAAGRCSVGWCLLSRCRGCDRGFACARFRHPMR